MDSNKNNDNVDTYKRVKTESVRIVKSGNPENNNDGTSTRAAITTANKRHTVVLKPGSIGVRANWKSGIIIDIRPGGQAETLGVKPGWQFCSIEDTPYSEVSLDSCMAGRQNYTVTFKVRSYSPPLRIVDRPCADDPWYTTVEVGFWATLEIIFSVSGTSSKPDNTSEQSQRHPRPLRRPIQSSRSLPWLGADMDKSDGLDYWSSWIPSRLALRKNSRSLPRLLGTPVNRYKNAGVHSSPSWGYSRSQSLRSSGETPSRIRSSLSFGSSQSFGEMRSSSRTMFGGAMQSRSSTRMPRKMRSVPHIVMGEECKRDSLRYNRRAHSY